MYCKSPPQAPIFSRIFVANPPLTFSKNLAEGGGYLVNCRDPCTGEIEIFSKKILCVGYCPCTGEIVNFEKITYTNTKRFFKNRMFQKI